MSKAYYIVSLEHTHKADRYLTLWRANNRGYCLSKEQAGVYSEIEDGYHNSEGQLPVECDKLEKLMITCLYDGVEKMFVPNCLAVWDELNVKLRKGELEKIAV